MALMRNNVNWKVFNEFCEVAHDVLDGNIKRLLKLIKPLLLAQFFLRKKVLSLCKTFKAVRIHLAFRHHVALLPPLRGRKQRVLLFGDGKQIKLIEH